MHFRKIILILVTIIGLGAVCSEAATMVYYSYETPPGVPPATGVAFTVDPLLSASSFSVPIGTDLGPGSPGIPGPPSPPFAYGGAMWTFVDPPPPSSTHFGFTLTTDPGVTMDLTSLSFALGYNSFSPGTATDLVVFWDITVPGVFTAVPGFGPAPLPTSGFGGSWTAFASSPLDVVGFSGTLEIRIMPYGGGLGLSLYIDDVLLDGTTHMAPIDSDLDGLPDSWELMFYPSITSVTASDDGDGDGHDNLTEYFTGTVPTNAASIFQVDTSSSNGVQVLRWFSIANRVYDIESTTNLLDGSFPPIPEGTNLPATPPLNVYTNTDTNALQLFRIGVSMP